MTNINSDKLDKKQRKTPPVMKQAKNRPHPPTLTR